MGIMTDELPCPLLACVAVSEDLLAKYQVWLSDPAWTRGRLALEREIIEAMHAALPCQPSIANDGNLTCSIIAAINRVIDAVFTKPGPYWALDLAELGAAAAPVTAVGQFL